MSFAYKCDGSSLGVRLCLYYFLFTAPVDEEKRWVSLNTRDLKLVSFCLLCYKKWNWKTGSKQEEKKIYENNYLLITYLYLHYLLIFIYLLPRSVYKPTTPYNFRFSLLHYENLVSKLSVLYTRGIPNNTNLNVHMFIWQESSTDRGGAKRATIPHVIKPHLEWGLKLQYLRLTWYFDRRRTRSI